MLFGRAVRFLGFIIAGLIIIYIFNGCCKDPVQKVFNQSTFGKSTDESGQIITPIGNGQFAFAGTIGSSTILTGIIGNGAPPTLSRLFSFIPQVSEPNGSYYPGNATAVASFKNIDGDIIVAGNQGYQIPILYKANQGNNDNRIFVLKNKDTIQYHQVKDIIQLRNKTYIVAGYAEKKIDNRAQDLMLTCISSDWQSVIWSNTYGASQYESGEKLVELSNNTFLVAGITNSAGAGSEDIFLMIFDSQGRLQFSYTMGTPYSDHTPRLAKVNDDIYVAFNSDKPDNADIIIAKLNANLSLQWSKIIGTPTRDVSRAIIPALDGNGIVLTGGTINDNSFGTAMDALFLRVDGNGNTAWAYAYGGCSIDIGNSIANNSDGYIILGNSESYARNNDLFIIKTDASGKSLLNDLSVNNLKNENITLSIGDFRGQIRSSFLSNTIIQLQLGREYFSENPSLSGAPQPTERKPCN